MNAWEAFKIGAGYVECTRCHGTGVWHYPPSEKPAKHSYFQTCFGCDGKGVRKELCYLEGPCCHGCTLYDPRADDVVETAKRGFGVDWYDDRRSGEYPLP